MAKNAEVSEEEEKEEEEKEEETKDQEMMGNDPCIEITTKTQPVAQKQEIVIGTLALLWYFMMAAVM